MSSISVGILGLGSYLPEKVLTNFDLEKMVDTSDEWIIKRTGISERRILEENIPSYTMGVKAAQKALEDAGVAPEEIELIIVTTGEPDYIFPQMACIIQKKIGAVNAAAFDMNAACTGFIYSLTIAQQFIKTGCYKKILLVACEGLSKVIDWKDRNTCVLFGDGAGAAVIGAVEEGYGVLATHLGASGEDGHNITLPFCHITDEEREKRPNGKEHSIWMDGKEVYKFAVNAFANSANKVVEEVGINIEDIDMFFPHQANLRIISGAAKKLQVPMEKMFNNIKTMSNISSACIPVGLEEASKKGMIKKGDKLLLVAFGGGLTYGAAIIKWCK